jgi:hypothetical protein
MRAYSQTFAKVLHTLKRESKPIRNIATVHEETECTFPSNIEQILRPVYYVSPIGDLTYTTTIASINTYIGLAISSLYQVLVPDIHLLFFLFLLPS